MCCDKKKAKQNNFEENWTVATKDIPAVAEQIKEILADDSIWIEE